MNDEEEEKNRQYGRLLIKKVQHSYEEILLLFTVDINSYDDYEETSYYKYAPQNTRERLFFLLILLSKLNGVEKRRTFNNTLGPNRRWLEKSAIIEDILQTKQIIDMTGIMFNIDIDEAFDVFYQEIKNTKDWGAWKTAIENIDFSEIDSQIEEIREQVCENENVKEKFRDIEVFEEKERFIDKIKEYLIKQNLLEKVRQSQTNNSLLSRNIAEEVFEDPSKSESIRQRLINIGQNKELKKEEPADDDLPY